jgi:hypothetical protein
MKATTLLAHATMVASLAVGSPARAESDPGSHARQILARGALAFRSLAGFRAGVRTFDLEPGGRGVHNGADLYYQAPGRFRMTVEPGFENAGITIAFDDRRDHIVVGPAQLFDLLRLPISLQDSRAKTSRGFSLVLLTVKAALGRFGDSRAEITGLGQERIGDRTAEILKATGPHLLNDVAEERLYLDSRTGLPVRNEQLSGHGVLYSATLHRFVANPVAPRGTFAF